jgi:hypothetical protein
MTPTNRAFWSAVALAAAAALTGCGSSAEANPSASFATRATAPTPATETVTDTTTVTPPATTVTVKRTKTVTKTRTVTATKTRTATVTEDSSGYSDGDLDALDTEDSTSIDEMDDEITDDVAGAEADLDGPSGDGSTYYANCSAARAAGAAPVYAGDPGYASHLDRDGDGVGCE